MKKILLYSGGSDSWLISKIWNPDELVYVDMHSRYSAEEIKRLEPGVKVISFPLGQWEREDAIIPLRNLYLIMTICNTFPEGDLEICLGATKGDRVLDKSPEFAKRTSELLSFLYSPQHWIPEGRKIKVCIDYKNKTKTEILREYLEKGGDIEAAWNQSFSCYNPTAEGKECWSCKPCFRKFVAFALNGKRFKPTVVDKVVSYINSQIMPAIEAGTYGRGEEEKEIKEVMRRAVRGELDLC